MPGDEPAIRFNGDQGHLVPTLCAGRLSNATLCVPRSPSECTEDWRGRGAQNPRARSHAGRGTRPLPTTSWLPHVCGIRSYAPAATGSSVTKAVIAAACFLMSSLIRIEQNLGPHMLQKAADLKTS
jgi:hypothetical protein